MIAALALAACSSPDRTWHEKVTVRLDTPWGERVGSTVTRMSYEQKSKLETWPTNNVHAIWRSGEAVVVDVRPNAPPGEPRYLFVLTPPPIFWPFELMHERLGLKRAQYEEMAPLIAGMMGEPPVPVPPRLVPMMVTFRDVADPASVMGVARTPEEATEKGWALPSEAFGAGVRLAGVTMEVVDEPITRGRIDQLLPWLGPDPEPSILPSVASDDFSVEAKLRHGDFRTVIP